MDLRRRGRASEGLSQPLLSQDSQEQDEQEEPEEQLSKQRREFSEKAASISSYPLKETDCDDFVWNVVTTCMRGWSSVWDTLSSCLQPLLPHQLRPYEVTLMQGQRLEELQARIQVPYDGTDEQHQGLLRKLWAVAFPASPVPSTLHSLQWKDMGWQGEDPGTDFRGAGVISLQNHLYMAQAEPALFARLLHKTQGERSDWEYPFAVAGVNLTFELSKLLDLRDPGQLPQTPAGRGFVRLLDKTAEAFEEVYCFAFELLDRLWLEARATYMDFPQVMKRTKDRVGDVLSKQYATLAQVRRALLESS